ncbi:phosphate signaling complex protein PhoU [Caldichromatium japonicum]|uniref:Phosphate-specific transport system accessory protein PhoU n=1 Tax=Caldichromatium japonicum TaxID=2699430 RepID=A0A6G7VE79_9GAMM|nr:phosphate signaling complex protein PhoU [Caldichromatium japonicum]QIK38349.1 phosphate signaling complex protein PhoU [Caldichromatium japonicum]
MSHVITLVQKKRSQLQERISELGAQVIAALHQSVECLRTQDQALAQQISAGNRLINHQRRLLEQECLVALAAFKPAGEDLRTIGACLEMASELERIGDYAADIARIIARDVKMPLPEGAVAAIIALANKSIAMLEQTLAGFLSHADESSLRAAVANEPQVDRDEDTLTAQILEWMRTEPEFVEHGTYLLWIAHNYERAADRATNIAERAVFAVAGHTPDLD